MFAIEPFLKNLEAVLKDKVRKLQQTLQAWRGSRPTADILDQIRVNYFNQLLTIRELASLSLRPPREIILNVWDHQAAPLIMKAVEEAKLGFSATTDKDKNIIRIVIPALSSERRAEFMKLVKHSAEEVRILIRHDRDEGLKHLKETLTTKDITEDQFYKTKDKVQKMIDRVNDEIERLVEEKLKELAE